jgi:hypothetical protein
VSLVPLTCGLGYNGPTRQRESSSARGSEAWTPRGPRTELPCISSLACAAEARVIIARHARAFGLRRPRTHGAAWTRQWRAAETTGGGGRSRRTGRGKTRKGEQVIPNQAVSEERHSGQCLLAPPPSTTTASASASAVTPSALCVAAGYPYARGRRGGSGGCDDRVGAGISWEVDDEGYDETRMTRKRFRLI